MKNNHQSTMGVGKIFIFVIVLCLLTFEVKLNWDRRKCGKLEQDCLEEFFMILTVSLRLKTDFI